MHSGLNFCITISVCGSATLYSGSIKLRLSIGTGAGAHSAPHNPITTTTPLAKGSAGAWHIASMLRPPLQRNSKCGCGTDMNLSGCSKDSRCISSWEEVWPCYYVTAHVLQLVKFIWGVQGREKKPDKLATVTCFTVSKAFKLIFHLWYA